MNRRNSLSSLFLCVVVASACRTAAPDAVPSAVAPPDVAKAVDRYVAAVLSGSVPEVQAALAPSARDRKSVV